VVNNRRSEFEIIGKLLDLSKDGAKKTELLYQANLSYTQLKSYLSFLIDKGIIEMVSVKNNGNNGTMYILTEKGVEFLTDINKTLSYIR
jgi:predicted transcriptional regulator